MKRLAIIIAGMLTSLLVASAQNYVRAGDGNYGKILYNWDGTVLHSGENKYGRGIVWTDGIDIRSGENKYGTLLFYRDGNRIKTESKYGKVVFTVQGSIPLPILIWISVID